MGNDNRTHGQMVKELVEYVNEVLGDPDEPRLNELDVLDALASLGLHLSSDPVGFSTLDYQEKIEESQVDDDEG